MWLNYNIPNYFNTKGKFVLNFNVKQPIVSANDINQERSNASLQIKIAHLTEPFTNPTRYF